MTNVPNWPMAGEIGIVEGIDNQSSNRMALHSGTSNSCTLNVMGSQGIFTDDILTTNCYTTAIVDVGCVIQDTDTRSYGYGFNDAQGGVFALVWDTSTGMSMWHFARANIPAGITNQTPTPANWVLQRHSAMLLPISTIIP